MKKYLFILSSVVILTACGNHKTSEVKTMNEVKTEKSGLTNENTANKSSNKDIQVNEDKSEDLDLVEDKASQEAIAIVSPNQENSGDTVTSSDGSKEVDYNAGLTPEDIARNEEYNGVSMTDEEIDAIDAELPAREDGLPRRSRGKASFPVDSSSLNEEVAMRIIREGLKEYDEKYGLLLSTGMKNKNGITVNVVLKNYPGEYGGTFPCFVKNDGSWQIVG
ncbi:hypothetical protein OZX68_06265 [Streptococcaceae bacterium ESL0729]|nr:hypothetical protein OZX68_06265 [Streptococcaceae bacterium ESL0729]